MRPSDTFVESYWTLDPVCKLWELILKLSVDVVTPLVVQLIVLTSKLCVFWSNLTLIDVDVPIPTESLGTTFKFTKFGGNVYG